MKKIAALAALAFFGVTIASSFSPAHSASFGAMSGKADHASKGYNTAAKEKNAKGTKPAKPKPQ